MLELGCGIMQHLLDFVPTYPKTRLCCKSLSGADINKEYLEFLSKQGVITHYQDLTQLPTLFADKSYDVVLMVDILEHLPTLDHAEALLAEAERIATKKTIAFTPTIFRTINPVGESWEEYGFHPSEYQRHHIVITQHMLMNRGYKVRDIKDKNNIRHLYGIKNLQPKKKLFNFF